MSSQWGQCHLYSHPEQRHSFTSWAKYLDSSVKQLDWFNWAHELLDYSDTIIPIQIYWWFCLPKVAFISEYFLAGKKWWLRCLEVQGPSLLFSGKSMHWVSKNLVTLGKLLRVVKQGYPGARLPQWLCQIIMFYTLNVAVLFVNYTSIKVKNEKGEKPPGCYTHV